MQSRSTRPTTRETQTPRMVDRNLCFRSGRHVCGALRLFRMSCRVPQRVLALCLRTETTHFKKTQPFCAENDTLPASELSEIEACPSDRAASHCPQTRLSTVCVGESLQRREEICNPHTRDERRSSVFSKRTTSEPKGNATYGSQKTNSSCY